MNAINSPNRLSLFLYLLMIVVFFFTNTTLAKSIVYKDINDLSAMQLQIKKDQPNKENTLVIFDIDDTLLESVNFVGSGKWYNWQRGRKVYDPSGKSFVIDKEQQFHCIFRTLGTLFEIGSTQLTQANAVDIFNQQKQFDLLILTARTAKYRVATERELKKHTINLTDEHFQKMDNGYDIKFNDGNRTARVTYKNGFIMSSGLNKGLVLEDFLKRVNRSYKNIYFIDDSLKNVNNMKNVWDSKPETIKIFHYTRVDKTVNQIEIEESDKAKIHFDGFLKNAYPDEFKAFQNNQCN